MAARLKRKRTWFLVLVLFFGGLFVALALHATLDVHRLRTEYPVMVYRGPNQPPDVRFQKARPRDWVKFSDIPREVIGAIIVSEDGAFYRHKGYDPQEIVEALKVDLKEGRYVRGASTITQQVAKNLFLGRHKSLWRKLKELEWAVTLEKTFRKSRIMEIYLNIAELGQGLYGVGPASLYYFNRPVSQLGAKEGAFLAMLLPSPKKHSASFRQRQMTPFAQRAVDRILRRMAQAGYITKEEAQRLAYAPQSFEEPEPAVEPEDEETPEPE
ncbi:MAG: biosynthetic peptidoglycan transglycosylase [Pseudomonadota bacterium]